MKPADLVVRGVTADGDRKVVDLAYSANLYLTTHQARLYSSVVQSRNYRNSVARPISRALSYLPTLLNGIRSNASRPPISICDCGPADDTETLSQMRAFISTTLTASVTLVDVNSTLLSRVTRAMRRDFPELPTYPITGAFEDLVRSDLRVSRGSDLLILFGATGMNYPESELKRLLSRLTKPGDMVMLENILDGGKSASQATFPYESKAVIAFAFEPLHLIGAQRSDFRSRISLESARLSVAFEAKKKVNLQHPKVRSLNAGDLVLTAISRRPTKRMLDEFHAKLFVEYRTRMVERRYAITVGMIGEAKDAF